jgi:hypothetical protein
LSAVEFPTALGTDGRSIDGRSIDGNAFHAVKLDPNPAGQAQIPSKFNAIGKRYLINKLNYISFQAGTILVTCKHCRQERLISLPAEPQPLDEDRLECNWVNTRGLPEEFDDWRFKFILVPDEEKLLRVEAELLSLNKTGLLVRLPEGCSDVSRRKLYRHPCQAVKARLIHKDQIFEGVLSDYTIHSFRVNVAGSGRHSETPSLRDRIFETQLSSHGQVVYAGACRMIRHFTDNISQVWVLEPKDSQFARLEPKEYRCERQVMVPPPDAVFRHPLSGKTMQLKVLDVSGVGFSVEDRKREPVIFPGLRICDLHLRFIDGFTVCCRALVVHRGKISSQDNGDGMIRCGLAIEDIDLKDHAQLMSLLNRAKDDNAYSNQAVDLESLWKFFFSTGFIYPKKFHFMQAEKETIKATLEKLYTRKASVSRHFIYQDQGVIVGHIAMLHFYAATWMIHHHAASPSQSIKAGINVLGQLNRYAFEFCRFEGADLEFVMCYYRPDNRFPERVFGGVYRYLKDANQCSQDTFAYIFLQRESKPAFYLPATWRLEPAGAEDFANIRSIYRQRSGGLLIDGLDLSPDSSADERLSRQYRRFGLMRRRYLISLKKENRLQALFMVTQSDPGLNFSSLTRCIHVLVADPDSLPAAILLKALSQLRAVYFDTEIPALIYPSNYADRHCLAYERKYNLWIIRRQVSDGYFRYMSRLARFF